MLPARCNTDRFFQQRMHRRTLACQVVYGSQFESLAGHAPAIDRVNTLSVPGCFDAAWSRASRSSEK